MSGRHGHSSHSSPGHRHAPQPGPGEPAEHVPPIAADNDLPANHEMASEHRKGLLPELYFRWRAGEITRLEAFCDVVFGFALTLLVVSLEVPRNYQELVEAMRGFVPFAACFAQLILIWRAHYRFSRRYGLEDPYTVFLNMVLLFLVLFYVYPLKFVFTLLFQQVTGHDVSMTFHEGSVLMRIYAAGFASVFLLFALMYAHAYRLRKLLGLNPVEVLETRVAIQENVIIAVVALFSFALAFREPAWSGWLFFLLGPVLGVHGSIFGKRVRKLAEKQGTG
jgi:uncharacterized membrane protein